MSNKNIQNRSAYERMLKEKEDANMRYIAELINEMYYMPSDEELEQVEIPEDFNNKMLDLAKKLDKKRIREARKKRMRVFAKRCAVILVCFITVGTVMVSSADAVKTRLHGLLTWFEEDHMVLKSYDYSDVEGLSNYYTFGKIPKGYKLDYYSSKGDISELVFLKGESMLLIGQYTLNTVVHVDTEKNSYEDIYINGDKAHYFQSKEKKTIIYMKDDCILEIESNGDANIQKKDMIKLAENIKLIE